MRLKGKIALVTGSSRGIGRAAALRLAAEGAAVGVHYIRQADAAEKVRDEIIAAGGDAAIFNADISNPAAVDEMLENFIEKFGRIDILVNNAGVTADCPLAGMQDDDWKKVIDTNLSGTFYMCRAAARFMMGKRYGRIVNVSSFISSIGGRGQANYAASKAGIEAVTRTLAIELGSRGVTVNSVCPGAVETDMSRETIEKARDKIIAATALKRLATPEEIAALIAFLASDDASYITGESIRITGGLGLLNW